MMQCVISVARTSSAAWAQPPHAPPSQELHAASLLCSTSSPPVLLHTLPARPTPTRSFPSPYRTDSPAVWPARRRAPTMSSSKKPVEFTPPASPTGSYYDLSDDDEAEYNTITHTVTGRSVKLLFSKSKVCSPHVCPCSGELL